ELVTDERASRYGEFPGHATHIVPSATLAVRNPFHIAGAMSKLCRGTIRALLLFRRMRPAAVVGFGGYPTIPPLLAAALRGIPTVIHEQNGVLGRAIRLLARRGPAIATCLRGVLSR